MDGSDSSRTEAPDASSASRVRAKAASTAGSFPSPANSVMTPTRRPSGPASRVGRTAGTSPR